MTESKDNTSPIDVYMAVGTTGIGKSSLIKIFCNDLTSIDLVGNGKTSKKSDIVGHSTKSQTKDTSFFIQKDNNRIWVDTMGTADSNDNISDKDVLRSIMSKMYKAYSNGLNVKVVWLVKPNVRNSKDLQTEAEFISSLSQYSGSNIWDSTLIIVKGDRLEPRDNCNGALAAARTHGASLDSDNKCNDSDELGAVDRMGYTKLSALKDNDEILEAINDGEFSEKYRLKMGYLYDEEIKNKVNEKLEIKPFIFIEFKDEICKKCGLRGDGRFMPAQCHKFAKAVHKNENDFVHTGSIKYKHKNSKFLYGHAPNACIKCSHKYESYSSRHSGKLVKKHESNAFNYSHSGDFQENYKHRLTTTKTRHNGAVKNKHRSTSTKEVKSGSKMCKNGTTKYCGKGHNLSKYGGNYTATEQGYNCKYPDCRIYKSDSLYNCTICDPNFNGSDGSKWALWCTSHITEKDDWTSEDTYKTVYSCCGQDYGSQGGCISEWTCCGNDSSHTGCIEEYVCCGQPLSSKGCVSEWSCCDEKSKLHKGCVAKYVCCDNEPSHPGCKEEWTCCSNGRDHKGCIHEWKCCGNGQYHKGCVETWSCCNNDRTHGGCIKSWSCCNESEKSKGCHEYYSCCNSSKDGPPCSYKCCKKQIKSNPKPCHKICRNCQVEWGKGPGCTQENVKHKF